MAKQEAKKVLYHGYFEGDSIGEADGFFEIKDGKLLLVDCWSLNDAHWRGEYMTGLLEWAGVELKDLPEKRHQEAEKLLAKTWGFDEEGESDQEREEIDLEYQQGNSDKVYHLSIFENADGWVVEAVFGRRGANPQHQIKCEGEDYETAKKLYDKTLNEKLKKGYEEA
jgi:predicted DNA-binding WGR domain protein